MRRRAVWLPALVVVAVAIACGGAQTGPESGSDHDRRPPAPSGGPDTDGGLATGDAGAPDAGGAADAGTPDAGMVDGGGSADGGPADGGALDAGTSDGGTGIDGGSAPDGGAECEEGWSAQATLQEPRAGAFLAELPDGRVLAAGGFDPQWSKTARSSVELFDPATGVWTWGAPMNSSRSGILAVQLESRDVFAIWGHTSVGSGEAPGAPEIYSPRTGTWSTVPRFDPRIKLPFEAAQLTDGRVMVLGGTFSDAGTIAQLFDPATRTWQTTSSPPHPYSYPIHALSTGGAILVGPTHVTEWDPQTGQWTDRVEIPTEFQHRVRSLRLSRDKLLVWGGDTETTVILDLNTVTWATGPRLPAEGCEVATTPNGAVLNIGGSLWLLRPDGTTRALPAPPRELAQTCNGRALGANDIIVLGGTTSAVLRICE